MLIYNAIVHTMCGCTHQNGYVAVKNGKIAQVGEMAQCPAQWQGEHLDAKGGHVLPAFIDAHCHLGLFGDALGFEGDDGNEISDPCMPHLRALDGVNPLDTCFAEARAAGVGTVLTGPGSANPISGQFLAMKTTGRWVDEMVVQAPIAMKLALGENPKMVYHDRDETPVTRMATAAIIRENLRKAIEYRDKLDAAQEDDELERPDFDAKLDALLDVVRGTLPVHIHAHRADDIATAVRLCKEFGLKGVIVHATQGHLIPQLLASEGIPVITGPCLGDRSKPELAQMDIASPHILHEHGVKLAICTDHPEVPIQHLPLCAAMAVKGGMSSEDALAAITINAAEIALLGNRLGSLSVGKDADIVLTNGHPLDLSSQVLAVVIDGVRV